MKKQQTFSYDTQHYISSRSNKNEIFVIFTWLSHFRTYVYDYITQLCRQEADFIQNHENANVRNIGQGEHRHRKDV
jgi:hypothetical protein